MEGNTGGGGLGGGGSDVELMSKTLQVEHKLFYFDLKENPRGRYLKISEKTTATRSTIIVPSDGVSWFLGLFNYYVNEDERDVVSKELQLETKVFYFDVGENRRGASVCWLAKSSSRLESSRGVLLKLEAQHDLEAQNDIGHNLFSMLLQFPEDVNTNAIMPRSHPSCPAAANHAQLATGMFQKIGSWIFFLHEHASKIGFGTLSPHACSIDQICRI
ncbi:Transcription factor Pur-alpha 1-like protein [Drosera capensis]